MVATGQDMLNCAGRQWFAYDDNLSFKWIEREDGQIFIADGAHSITVRPSFFFQEHKRLIFEGQMMEHDVHPSYWSWANKVNGADADDYDDYTCDFVLQIMLYGKVIYS